MYVLISHLLINHLLTTKTSKCICKYVVGIHRHHNYSWNLTLLMSI